MAIPAVTALKKAAKGLLYMSEKDAPFTPILLKGDATPTAQNIDELLHAPIGSPVEEVPFVKFFADLTKVRKWHAEDDKAVVKRYQNLLDAFRENLTSLKVFKIGKVRLKIAILGKTPDGHWVGLQTDSLET